MTRRTPYVFALIAGFAGLTAGLSSASAWEVVPHRAIYKLGLASATGNGGGGVADVSGRMLFQWGDECDGWSVEQRYSMDFLYAQGDSLEVRSIYATWEAKDGSEFSFNLRNATNGQPDKEVRGHASMGGNGQGVAEFRLPEEATLDLPTGTLFPTAHTLRLLERAEAGDRLFVAPLFDGTELNKLTDISVTIGDSTDAPKAGSRQSGLLEHRSWPTSMAFFDRMSTEAEPEYEMAVRLYDNGVMDEMLIDYGDFTVRATLTELEALEPAAC